MSDALEFKSNSNKSREAEKEAATKKKQVDKVVNGPVRTKKNKEMKRFADVFISEDAANVKSFIVLDILVPAIKKTITDVVTNTLDMVFFGGSGAAKSKLPGSKVSYGKFYEDRNRTHVTPSEVGLRAGHAFDDIVLSTRGEAEAVLTGLENIIEEYDVASVADLYDLVGLDHTFTDNNYGWNNLHHAYTERCRGGGYIIKLPKAQPINKL